MNRQVDTTGAGVRPALNRQGRALLWSTVLVCLCALFVSSGAYDTDDLAGGHRFALWMTVVVLVVGQTVLVDNLLASRVPGTPLLRLAVGLAVIAATNGLVTIQLHLLKFTPLLPKQPDPLVDFYLFCLPPVAAIGAGVLALRESFRLRPFRRAATAPAAAQAAELECWPSGRVNWVAAGDHYLTVATADGERLIRGRMRDAIARLNGDDGFQVHRSWWVARHFVLRIRRRGRDYKIELADGRVIPLGRNRVGELRRRGLL